MKALSAEIDALKDREASMEKEVAKITDTEQKKTKKTLLAAP